MPNSPWASLLKAYALPSDRAVNSPLSQNDSFNGSSIYACLLNLGFICVLSKPNLASVQPVDHKKQEIKLNLFLLPIFCEFYT